MNISLYHPRLEKCGDVLPLKAARRDVIANLKCFGASDTRDLISMITFTFTMRRHFIRRTSAPFVPPVWQRLVGFGFRVQRVGSTVQNYEGWV